MAIKRGPTMAPARWAFRLARMARWCPPLRVALEEFGYRWIKHESDRQKKGLGKCSES